jgi:UTP--glucose-1-phosphate uridylyltransferase
MKHPKITKAVIAAAGYGTRFLPATKNQPKEMLPIIEKPIIQYLVEEAVESGITDIILVTRAGQHIMEDYFDNNLELEYSLEEAGKEKRLEQIRQIPQMANFVYVRQKKHLPYGNGTPLLAAKSVIDDDEAIVYMFGDDLTLANNGTPVTKQLIDIYEKHHPAAVIAVQEVAPETVDRYGIIKYKDNPETPHEIESLIEKPKVNEAPSAMAQFGRFVFSSEVLRKAHQTPKGKDDELWIADMLNALAQEGRSVIAQPIDGEWVTTGDPLNYLKATIKFAMRREDLSEEFKKFIQETVC